MPFPLPAPDEIARGQEAAMEAALRALKPDADGKAIARAVRSEKGLVAAHVRTDALGLYETHLHLRWWGDQYMPDTAETEHLVRHASIWGVSRRPATKAVGHAIFTGVPGTVIPAGLQLRTPAGAVVETIAAGTISGTGEIGLGLQAIEGGRDANTPGEVALPIVTTLVGLDPQSATLDLGGLAGGAEQETDGSLLARLLETIREPGHGGADFDYPRWVTDSFAALKVRTIPNWVGLGSVGVVVAMIEPSDAAAAPPLPRVPTGAEIIAIAAKLETLRPVTAEVVVLAYVPLVQPFTIRLTPDTAANRAAVVAALADHFAREAQIGTPMPRSRLSEAISAANGEYSHALTIPAGDIVPAPRELASPGAITWAAP